MRNALLVVLGIIDILANLPYIIDTVKGKTKPNIASWSTLTLINAITAIAGFTANNAFNTAVLGFSYLIGSITILVLACIKGTRKYTLFDGFFQSLAIIGIVLWQISDNPTYGLITVIIVGELAAIPMYRHAYQYPDEETWSTFLIASLVALGTLTLATNISFASLAVPFDLVLGNGFITLVILIRRSKKQLVHKVPQPIL